MAGGDTDGATGAFAAPLVRLTLFVAGLAVLAGLAALAGRASGIDVDDATAPGHETLSAPSSGVGNGLSDSSAGLRLALGPTNLSAGTPAQLRLQITDENGSAVTDLDETHDEPPLHLILVRRDLTGYQHLHPVRSGDGFRVELILPRAGIWRAYADFEIGGEKVVLGRDLVVPGRFTPQSLATPAHSATTAGYRVQITSGELRAGAEQTVSFDVRRGSQPVKLEPYLGAEGHLVAIREDDLAYLHVHPLESSAPGVAFDAEFAEPGRYALFLQFKHAGRVQTAPFTIEVTR